MNVRKNAASYSRGVGVRAWCDCAGGCRLQHLRGAHHHVKLTCVLRDEQEKKKTVHQKCVQGQRTAGETNCRSLTSSLRDRWVGGGLHRHGRGRAVADGGGGEIGEPRLSSHGLPTGTAPIAERVLDNSLQQGGIRGKSVTLSQESFGCQ